MKFWISDCGDFISRHWGDFIGLLILYTGVALVLWAGAEKGQHIGESLVLAAMGVLKLRSNPKNGNGNGNGNGHSAT